MFVCFELNKTFFVKKKIIFFYSFGDGKEANKSIVSESISSGFLISTSFGIVFWSLTKVKSNKFSQKKFKKIKKTYSTNSVGEVVRFGFKGFKALKRANKSSVSASFFGAI